MPAATVPEPVTPDITVPVETMVPVADTAAARVTPFSWLHASRYSSVQV